jgi:4-amino-4-deoxy-L-arabinose transferase-like glycosyltransferase
VAPERPGDRGDSRAVSRLVPRSFRWRVVAVAAAGVAIRLFYVIVLTPDVRGAFLGDWDFFNRMPRLLAEGKGYVEPIRLRISGESVVTASHPPLWPWVLTLPALLGLDSPTEQRSVGALLGGFTIVAMGYLGRRVGGERIGLLSAAIFAGYPLMVAADGSLMSEGLYGLIVALMLLAAYRLYDRGDAVSAALLGGSIGLAMHVRSEAILFAPLLVLPVVWRVGRHRARNLALAGAVLVLVITPWTVRNFTVFDRPVLMSTQGPAAVAGANCAQTYRGPDIGYWRLECVSRPRTRNEAREGPRWFREGIDYMRERPGRLPAVVAARLGRTWDVFQPRRMVLFAEGRHYRAEQLGIATYFLLVPLALLGALALRRRGEPLWILLSPFVLVTIVTVAVYGIPRFRHAAEIPLVVLAAVGMGSLLDRWRLRRA